MGTQSTWEERQYHETKKSTNLASPTDVLFPAGQDGAWRVVSRNGNKMQGERREATHRDRGGHAPLGRQGRKGGWPIGVQQNVQNRTLSVRLGTSKLLHLLLGTGACSSETVGVRRRVNSIFGARSKIVRIPVSGTRMLQCDNWQNNLTKYSMYKDQEKDNIISVQNRSLKYKKLKKRRDFPRKDHAI